MENEQKTELAAPVEAAPVTPEAAPAPAASAVQPETKKEYVSTEPRHPLQDILDKAAEKAKAKEATSQEVKPEALVQKTAEQFDLAKWDGNIQALPEKLKKIVTDNQAAFHEKAKEAATLKQNYEALQAKVNEYAQQLEQKNQKPLFTEEEFQAAQLDPNKFLELTTRVAQNIVDSKAKEIEPLISQIQWDKSVAENEKLINDFATKNPDFWELYESKILEPLVKEHGLEKGYQLAKDIKTSIANAELAKSQARVQDKKAATSALPTQPGVVEVVYINRGEDAMRIAAEYAAKGQKVKVRYKPS